MSYGQPNPYEQAPPAPPAQEAGYSYGQVFTTDFPLYRLAPRMHVALHSCGDDVFLPSAGAVFRQQPAADGLDAKKLAPDDSANPYAQDSYELQENPQTSSYQNSAAAPAAAATASNTQPLSQQDFLSRVQSLRNDITRLTGDIETIGQLHQRSLGAADPQADQQLEHYVAQTQIRNTAIKDGIKGLERDLARTSDATRKTKQTQLQSLRTFFKSELDSYQSIEREYRQKYRDQIARQYRIVNPDASEQEVQQAAETDWGNEGVFQTALRTNRSGHASSVLGNVRARHNELQRIEQTLTELAVLYQELATMVEQQETIIVDAENKGQDVVDNLESGNQQVSQANKSARNRRKLKWWCLFIVVLIIIAAVLGIALGVTLTKNATKS